MLFIFDSPLSWRLLAVLVNLFFAHSNVSIDSRVTNTSSSTAVCCSDVEDRFFHLYQSSKCMMCVALVNLCPQFLSTLKICHWLLCLAKLE